MDGEESEVLFLMKGLLNAFNLYAIRVFREWAFAGRGAHGCTA